MMGLPDMILTDGSIVWTPADGGRLTHASLQALIFDLDGTLCDTIPVCIAAFQTAFATHAGREFSDAEIRALFGPDEEGMIRRVVPDHWQACLDDYLAAYDRKHDACPAPFSGMLPLLSGLSERGVPLAIVTGKGRGSAEISLRRLALSGYFDVVETGSARGAVKPERIRAVLARWGMLAGTVAYVGDSPFDMRDARATGVRGLAAGWAASTDVEALRAETPDVLFSSVGEFTAWIERHVDPR